jgi:hypothetical protein
MTFPVLLAEPFTDSTNRRGGHRSYVGATPLGSAGAVSPEPPSIRPAS